MQRKVTLLLFLSLFLAARVGADPIAFQVDNTAIETTMAGGQTQTEVITVSNIEPNVPSVAASATSVRLRIYPVDWTLDRNGKPIFAPAGSMSDSCSNWLKISPLELELAPGSSQQVRYSITVPDGVQGTFRSMIMVETVPEPGVPGHRVMIVNGRIGSALYVTVGPQAKRLRIDSFGVTPEDALLTVENTGNTHVRLKGTLQFQDATGNVVDQLKLPSAVVLSGQNNQRDFDISTPKLPSGTYTVVAVIDYGGSVLVGARTHVTVP